LQQAQVLPGHLVTVLQVIVAPQLDLAIRQAASIHFKQILSKGWEPKEGDLLQFSKEDKEMVRSNLLESIAQSPPLIRSQLSETLKVVIYNDYPHAWPDLILLIVQNYSSQEQPRLYGALTALRILSNKYEFKDEDERQPIQEVVNLTFPALLQIFQHLLKMESAAVELADLMKLICKTFWSTTYLDIPQHLLQPPVFMAWMAAFEELVLKPVPLEGQPEDADLRKAWPWWKLKKWSMRVINRMFSRLGDPKLLKEDQKMLAQHFRKQWACKFLQSYLQLLDNKRKGAYLPDRVINLALQYLTTAVLKPVTYKMMKPQLELILFEMVFPLLCFNEQDAELWRDDVHEYVRKGYDIIEDMYSPRTAAMNFVVELVNFKSKENLQRFITFVVNIFMRYNESPPEARPYAQKDGALLAIGSLSDKLKHTIPYKHALEDMLVAHVFPEFQSPVGHIRAKAAWVSGQYADIEFKNPQHFVGLLQCIVRGLRDPELPVRVDSVVALRNFVDASQDLNEIRAILPQLLDELFRLMNEVENEDLVFTLETIVEKFGEEIAPFALGLCQNLTAAFWKCLGDDAEEDDDVGALAAVGCLRAISTIMESVSTLPHLYPQLEQLCMPIMFKMLSAEEQDVYEEVLEMVSYLTYYSPQISPAMWELFPVLCKAIHDWAVDYFENILIPLDNYISRGTATFLNTKEPHNYLLMTMEVLKLTLGDLECSPPKTPFPDDDTVPAPKLIGTILQHCPGQVDECVEPMLMMALRRLQGAERNHFKCLLITVVANALYYNAALALQILQKHGVLSDTFAVWFQMLYKTGKKGKRILFTRAVDKKICSLGLMSMLALPAESLPLELQAGMGQVLPAAMALLSDLKILEEEDALRESRGYGDDEDEDLDDGEEEDADLGEDEEEDINEEEIASLLSKQRAKEIRFGDEDDSDDDWALDDDDVESALDSVNPYIFFSNIVKSVSTNDPARFSALTSSMDQANHTALQRIVQLAEEKQLEDQQKQQAAANALLQAPVLS